MAAINDNIGVIVTIEPELPDFETACKALGNAGKGELSQLPRVGLISGHKIGKRTDLRLAELRRFIESRGSWESRNV